MKKQDGRRNNGGARKNAGRKKGIGLTYEIEKHCRRFIEEMLTDEAIRYRTIKQLSLNFDNNDQDCLYIIEVDGMYKIGYSSNINRRLKQYELHNPSYNLAFLIKSPNSFQMESTIHESYKKQNIKGEWFNLTKNDLLDIISYCSKTII